MSTKIPIPPASSIFAVSRRSSFLRAGKSPNRSLAPSLAIRSRKLFCATSYNPVMPLSTNAGTMPPSRRRCHWAQSEAMVRYHDEEWGVPVHDDRLLFEFLILEGAQAGLSWSTILRRREGYRHAYRGFDPEAVARFGERDVARLLADVGIIRNKAKVAWSIRNAQAFLDLQHEHGSFAAYLWAFSGGAPIVKRPRAGAAPE